jgi:hypothetical protein
MTRVNLSNPGQEIKITPWKANKKNHKFQFSINPKLKNDKKLSQPI